MQLKLNLKFNKCLEISKLNLEFIAKDLEVAIPRPCYNFYEEDNMSTVGIVPEEEAQRKPSESRVQQMLVSFWSFLSYLVVFIPISKKN